MSTTLNIESFSPNNLRERTTLELGIASGNVLKVESTQGFASGEIIYIGQLSREGCERAVIQSVPDALTINLVTPLVLPHARFEPVTSVLGDLIHIYRAANVDGTVPPDTAFSVLATRNIDPDQLSTYNTDSSGSSSFWYRSTYYNATSLDETDLGDSVPVRGDDFGHYASLSEIRLGAGFENNYNIRDTYLAQVRRAAESEINSSMSNAYTTPFSPVPDEINSLTIDLAVGMIWSDEYGANSAKAKGKLTDARASIKGFQSRDSTINGADGQPLSGAGVSFWPDESVPTQFIIGDKF